MSTRHGCVLIRLRDRPGELRKFYSYRGCAIDAVDPTHEYCCSDNIYYAANSSEFMRHFDPSPGDNAWRHEGRSWCRDWSAR